jgi:aspartate carbamoyltransferase catalytic subunit
MLKLMTGGKDLIKVDDLGLEQVTDLFQNAEELGGWVNEGGYPALEKATVSVLFVEPVPDRTVFESAVRNLGAGMIGMFAPSAPGSNIDDLIAEYSPFCQAMVIRHRGLGRLKENAFRKPIISAGDITGHNPFGALYQLFTLWREWKGQIAGRRITLIGDLTRDVAHSFAILAAGLGARIALCSPSDRKMPDWALSGLAKLTVPEYETDTLMACARSDAAFFIRSARHNEVTDYDHERRYESYQATEDLVGKLHPETVVLTDPRQRFEGRRLLHSRYSHNAQSIAMALLLRAID